MQVSNTHPELGYSTPPDVRSVVPIETLCDLLLFKYPDDNDAQIFVDAVRGQLVTHSIITLCDLLLDRYSDDRMLVLLIDEARRRRFSRFVSGAIWPSLANALQRHLHGGTEAIEATTTAPTAIDPSE